MIAVLAAACVCNAAAAQGVACIDVSIGKVIVERGTNRLDVRDGMCLQRGDLLLTADGARAAVSFKDGSRLQLGEGTSLVVSGAFRTGASISPPGALRIELQRGLVRLTSGSRVATQADRIDVRTAPAVVSVNAADIVLIATQEGLSLVVLEGRAEVRNDAGLVEIDRARRGIDNLSAAHAPTQPFGWSRERIRGLLARLPP